MISRLYLIFLLILLMVLALLMFGLNNVIAPRMIPQNNSLFNQPDYIIENLSGIQKNHEEAVAHVFSAKKMLHYLDEEITYLEQPYFISNEPGKPVMRIKAGRAELLENGENIHLTDNVSVLRGVEHEEDKITLTTSYLHLIPNNNLAKTHKSVAITTKNATMDAVGLELNNQTGVLKLLSRVKVAED